MRNALATLGQMVVAVLVAAVVAVVSLVAISGVQWPAFPSSNQLHALTTVGQVGCILGLLCAGWLWRRGRGRTLARLLAPKPIPYLLRTRSPPGWRRTPYRL